MNGRNAVAPVIIKRKKIVAGGGHHGGAWKVAYADFVTAMMAFFMLMWLLNATTEKQRKGLADYFNPTIPINRISGGGDGAFGGQSVFSEEVVAQNGTGASSQRPSAERQAKGPSQPVPDIAPEDRRALEEIARKIDEALMGLGGESVASAEIARHILVRVTDEGLIVEIFDTPDQPLFEPGTAEPRPVAVQLVQTVTGVFALAENRVAVNGHVQAHPKVLQSNPGWELSAERAMAVRRLMETSGLAPERLDRVSGFADRRPSAENPLAPGNNRIEIILLRSRP